MKVLVNPFVPYNIGFIVAVYSNIFEGMTKDKELYGAI